jgi:hypothetical protein
MRFDELPMGAFFTVPQKPELTMQKLCDENPCGVTGDWKLILLRDDVECIPKPKERP